MINNPEPLPRFTLVPLDAPFIDDRGIIQNIVHRDIGSVVVITSTPGSTRASHWHRSDWHYCFVMSGRIDYFEREVDSKACPRFQVIKEGELFFTPPRMEHEMYFPVATTFLTLANLHRSPAAYEDDLVRLPTKLREAYVLAMGKVP